MKIRSVLVTCIMFACLSCASNNIRIDYEKPNATKTKLEELFYKKIKGKRICFEGDFKQNDILIQFDNELINSKNIPKYDTIKNYSYCFKYNDINSHLKIRINNDSLKIKNQKIKKYKFIYIKKVRNSPMVVLTNKPHIYK